MFCIMVRSELLVDRSRHDRVPYSRPADSRSQRRVPTGNPSMISPDSDEPDLAVIRSAPPRATRGSGGGRLVRLGLLGGPREDPQQVGQPVEVWDEMGTRHEPGAIESDRPA